jgi:2-dehydropantoate 2-reductase
MTTVAVLGAGAVGGMLAVRTTLAGARVTCVARHETAAAIARDGLTLELEHERLHAHPAASGELEEPVDVLVVAVKAFDLVDALRRVEVQSNADGVVLALLNGLEHVDVIRQCLGSRLAVGSIARLEAYRRTPTTIVQTTPLPVVSIASGTVEAAGLAPVFDLLRAAGIDAHPGVSERAVLWQKAARLAPLAAVTATTGKAVGEILADRELRARLEAALVEACAVAHADGVEVDAAEQWQLIEGMPATLTTSTARDVAAGRPSELDAIAGAVVRAGRRLDVPTPMLAHFLAQEAA